MVEEANKGTSNGVRTEAEAFTEVETSDSKDGKDEQKEVKQKESTKSTEELSLDDDEKLISEVETLVKARKVLVAARLLESVKDQSKLDDGHHKLIQQAKSVQSVIDLHLSPPESGWKTQSESHGHRDTMIYYQVDDQSRLTCRIETPIESSLLIPLISVFNETELFHTWMPRWEYPMRVGLEKTEKLKEMGIGCQIIHAKLDMPWPLKNRDVVQEVCSVDEIDDDNHAIVIWVESCDEGDDDLDGLIPPPLAKDVRMKAEIGIMIRKCPEDHPCLAESKAKYPSGEHLILMSLTTHADAHVKFVPQSIINFVTRTVLGGMWGSTLKLAEGIRNGKSPLHQEAIEANRSMYDWVEGRVETLFSNIAEK
mmetsp:Transcript_22336/g.32986  ORF Transcript_22336/g.32986 Transcript_22336/m.32986 type:complete len:368 (+) Transcript_22336:124-1227(+)